MPMKISILILGCLAFASSAFAQAGTNSTLAWDQPNTTATEANTYTFRMYPDGSATGTVLAGVTCSGAAPVVCLVPFPAFTPGSHTLQLTAGNVAGESAKSAAFAFTFVVVPSIPTAIRIQ